MVLFMYLIHMMICMEKLSSEAWLSDRFIELILQAFPPVWLNHPAFFDHDIWWFFMVFSWYFMVLLAWKITKYHKKRWKTMNIHRVKWHIFLEITWKYILMVFHGVSIIMVFQGICFLGFSWYFKVIFFMVFHGYIFSWYFKVICFMPGCPCHIILELGVLFFPSN